MPAPTTSPATSPTTAPATPEVAPQRPELDEGDHDRFAHYVSKRELEKARRTGKAVTALCGKKWRPNADPSRYPVCQTCADIVAEAMSSSFD